MVFRVYLFRQYSMYTNDLGEYLHKVIDKASRLALQVGHNA